MKLNGQLDNITYIVVDNKNVESSKVFKCHVSSFFYKYLRNVARVNGRIILMLELK